MKITREFIHQHKTPRGAWTRAQLSALGIAWPPREGWITRLAGVEITDDQRDAFIAGRTKRASGPHNPDFSQFWRIYPLKIGKLAAERAYDRARKGGVSAEELVEGVERYIASKPGFQNYCHPSTWLNGMRWLDEDERPLTGSELAFARTVLNKRQGHCLHDPPCPNSFACLNA